MSYLCPHVAMETFYKQINVKFEISTSYYPHFQSLVGVAQI